MGRENVKTITVVPTVDTSAYASGDRFGSLMTLTDVVDSDGDGCVLESVMIFSKTVLTSPAFYVMFFDDVPTIASADNAAIDITDAEMAAKFVGWVAVGTSKNLAGSTIIENLNVERYLDCKPGSRNLYALLVVEFAPTIGAASDITVKFKLRGW